MLNQINELQEIKILSRELIVLDFFFKYRNECLSIMFEQMVTLHLVDFFVMHFN